jgi:predicted cobalt transporter CbtA
MERKLILRGVLAGGIGGVLAFLFARILAEPLIQQAIDYEEGREHAQAALNAAAGIAATHDHADPISRTVQGNAGIGVALILFGMAMGALFAVAYALCLGRTGRVRPRTLALLVAGAGFLGFYAVPFLKYPANPPAVGNENTIQQRTGLYLIMVAVSILLLVLCTWLGRRLQPRAGPWRAALLAGGVFIVATAVVMVLLPSLGELAPNRQLHQATETPAPLTDPSGRIVFPGFPADLLYRFRLYSIGAQLVLWAAIGLVFAPMAERLLAPPRAGRTPDTPAPAAIAG